MKKLLPIQISIPEPCHENWDAMTPAEQGRFCSKCQKCVTDFTGWTDSEIYNYISKNSGQRICGRLHSTQMNRTIVPPYQPSSQLYKYFIGLGLTLLLSQLPESKSYAKAPITYTLPIAGNSEIPNNDSTLEIKGTVLDDKKEPIIGATIRFYASGHQFGGAASDLEGYFSITLRDSAIKALQGVELKAIVTYIGFFEKTIIFDLYQLTMLNHIELMPNLKGTSVGLIISGYKIPLIDRYAPGTGQTFTSEQIEQMAH